MYSNNYELYCLIMECGKASKAIRIGKANGVRGATIIMGKGTVHSSFLNFMGLHDDCREIVLMGAEKTVGDVALQAIAKELEMRKPSHGIAFTIPLTNIIGTQFYQENITLEKEENNMNYKLVITIVEKGKAEQVIDAAKKAGSQGGTILGGRGSGVHETKRIFNIEIEPEKEIILIVAKNDRVDAITKAIREEMHIDDPGKGIIFVTEVTQTIGLFGSEKDEA